MATFDELMQAAKNADKAGDEAAARKLVQAAIAQRDQSVQPAVSEDKPDTALEIAGDVTGAALAGAGRGVLGALELPEMAVRAVARAGQEGLQALGLSDSEDIPVLDTYTGQATDYLVDAAGAGDALDYRGETRAAKFAGTIGEFGAGGGGIGLIGKGAKAAALASGAAKTKSGLKAAKAGRALEQAGLSKSGQALSAASAVGSEAAGQLTEGTAVEGIARFAGALVAPSAAVKALNTGNKTLNAIRGKNATVPTIKDLYKEKTFAYEKLRKAGTTFGPAETDFMVDAALTKAYGKGAFDTTDDAFVQAKNLLGEIKGKSINLNEFDKIQRKLGKIYRAAKDQPQILDMMTYMDDALAKKAGNNNMVRAAREANKKYSKALLLEKTFQKHMNQAKATGSGGNVVNKYRQSLQKILDDENKIKFFNQVEREAMQRIVTGSLGANTLRVIGKMAPTGNGLMQMLNFVTFTINPAFLFMTGGAQGAKMLSERNIRAATKQLQDIVKTGGAPKDLIDKTFIQSLLAAQGGLPQALGALE